jgi:DnaK suppressor protein
MFVGRSSMVRRPICSTEGSAMARKDAMSALRQILIRRRDALRKALAGDLSLLKELRQQNSGDVIDAALDSAQDEISSQLAEVESRELTHIETALERMRKGDYGVCDGCNQGIPLARLQALPYATMCIQCQREAEKNGEDVGGANWNRILDVGLADNDVSVSDLEIDV